MTTRPKCPQDQAELIKVEGKWLQYCPICRRQWTLETTMPSINGKYSPPLKVGFNLVQICTEPIEEEHP